MLAQASIELMWLGLTCFGLHVVWDVCPHQGTLKVSVPNSVAYFN
jgi:hypothetical protein